MTESLQNSASFAETGITGQKVNLRRIGLEILLEVNENGVHSHQVLKSVLDKYSYLPKNQRAFLTRLVEGTLEYQLRLDYIIGQYANIPVRKIKPVIREILRMGVYQLLFMDRVPVSAVCNESVKLAEKKGFYGLKGFVNGVLRNVARNGGNIVYPDREKEPVKALSVCYSMPEWIVAQWLKSYSADKVEKMLAASLKPQPLCVRFRHQTEAECAAALESEGVHVRRHPYLSYAYVLDHVDRIESLSVFRKGMLAVQDISSMLVGQIAAPKAGDFIIDVCGAPGGKSLHMADLLTKAEQETECIQGSGYILTRDISEYKLALIRENQSRLGITNMTTELWDATVFCQENIEKADIVLADVPCSGLGVLGKKKEIKYRMTGEQIDSLAALQRKILDTVWKYVKPGGLLIYSTCTVSKKENEDNVRWFLENYPFKPENPAGLLVKELRDACCCETGSVQLLQGGHQSDGFFIARLRRKENEN